jgi:tetratricopeptide (TPR) repeat protein
VSNRQTERALAASSTKTWPEILADCDRLLSPTDDSVATDKCPLRRRARPEAAFRITLRESKDGATRLESVLGGIPNITPCVVHSVPSLPDARWLHPDEEDRPVGVAMRRARREDLYLFYRDCDASLVLYTLPEKHQSTVILVPLQDGIAIRQSTLGGNLCRIAFGSLAPGRYLIALFSMVRADDLHLEAQLLRKQGMYDKALSLIEEVLELNPENFEAWTRKGCLLRLLGRRDEAMIAVKKALRINPRCALAWRAKGALLRDADKDQQGLNCYLRSLQLDPTDFLCWQNKGNALTTLNRIEEAKEAYAEAEKVKEMYPEERY